MSVSSEVQIRKFNENSDDDRMKSSVRAQRTVSVEEDAQRILWIKISPGHHRQHWEEARMKNSID